MYGKLSSVKFHAGHEIIGHYTESGDSASLTTPKDNTVETMFFPKSRVESVTPY